MLEGIKAPLRRLRAYRALRFAYHFATDRTFRADHVMYLRRPGNLFQYRSFTREDRYPGIFAFVRERLAGVPQPRLLSFGCATGEEVFSLRRYFPTALITGIDINAQDVAVCRARQEREGDANMTFIQADSAGAEMPGSYDAVFCMAVFQHSALKDPSIRSCEAYIRFAAFEATLAGIARCIKPGGYLAMRHADFRFADAACSQGFVPVMRLPPGGLLHPRFDRNNQRLPGESDADVAFQKRSE
jgi:SAM-dependent methyltransferase